MRALHHQRGATVIEAAIALFPFMGMIFFIILLSIWVYMRFTATYSLQDTVRWASIGQVVPPATNRVDSIKTYLVERANSFGVDISSSNIKVCSTFPAGQCAAEDAGYSGGFYNVTVTKPDVPFFKNFLPFITVRVTAIGRNE